MFIIIIKIAEQLQIDFIISLLYFTLKVSRTKIYLSYLPDKVSTKDVNKVFVVLSQ